MRLLPVLVRHVLGRLPWRKDPRSWSSRSRKACSCCTLVGRTTSLGVLCDGRELTPTQLHCLRYIPYLIRSSNHLEAGRCLEHLRQTPRSFQNDLIVGSRKCTSNSHGCSHLQIFAASRGVPVSESQGICIGPIISR